MTPDKAAELVTLDSRTDWREFADTLFRLEDADPGYMLLHRAELSRAQKLRYVLAWCAFYNPGLAAVASEKQGADFYATLRAMYPTAKRASERRHFRGQAGLKALAQWEERFPKPEAMVEACFGETYFDVRRNMKDMAQMGDYFYWKLADIQDTVFSDYVDFTGSEKHMPKVPKQGAEVIYQLESRGLKTVPLCSLEDIMADITQHISHMEHPFNFRTLELQEAETVCCVFKQHVNGSYQYGFRTAKAVRRLQSMQKEAPRTVKKLLDGMWAGNIWDEASVARVGGLL